MLNRASVRLLRDIKSGQPFHENLIHLSRCHCFSWLGAVLPDHGSTVSLNGNHAGGPRDFDRAKELFIRPYDIEDFVILRIL